MRPCRRAGERERRAAAPPAFFLLSTPFLLFARVPLPGPLNLPVSALMLVCPGPSWTRWKDAPPGIRILFIPPGIGLAGAPPRDGPGDCRNRDEGCSEYSIRRS